MGVIVDLRPALTTSGELDLIRNAFDPSDPFDPRNWDEMFAEQYEHRIYGDDNASIWCIVDEEDYEACLERKWYPNKPHPTRKGNKHYFRSLAGWREGGSGIYLHVFIMRRTGIEPPTPLHIVVDHVNDDEFDCRRCNLQWMTHAENTAKANKARAVRRSRERTELIWAFREGR